MQSGKHKQVQTMKFIVRHIRTEHTGDPMVRKKRYHVWAIQSLLIAGMSWASSSTNLKGK